MEVLSPQNITVFFLSLGILLGTARLLGDLAQRIKQPSVVGELLAGVLLGPTIFGYIAPELSVFLFPLQGPNAIALEAVAVLSVTLFLLVAGIEVDLSTIWRQGMLGLKIALTSMALPFAIGFSLSYAAPVYLGQSADVDRLVFALFFATALSISALPVIAKTLMDMNLYRSDLGMVVISAAIFNDLIGWIIFAIVLGLMGASAMHNSNIIVTIFLTLAFAGAMLTVGRWAIHKTLPFVEAHTRWPGGVLGFALTIAIFSAAFTEWIGIHAIFGAFLAGVAIGDSSHLREHTRVTIEHFISSILAPVFFASIGLKVNFAAHFDFMLTLKVILLACACKLIGGVLGGLWGGMTQREAWSVGFAMNSRGAMEIILGLLALNAGIINHRMFVALICMAIVTSMMSGPMIRIILQLEKKKRLQDFLSEKLFLRELKAGSPLEVIGEMTDAACEAGGLDSQSVKEAVWSREKVLSTGIGKGVALPHARIQGLNSPRVVVGLSDAGIDFNSPDGKSANLIFLILTPSQDTNAQLELASTITRIFRQRHLLEQVIRVKNFNELMSLIQQAETKTNKP